MEDMEYIVTDLIKWLTENRPNTAPYSINRASEKYYKLVNGNGSVYCFIPKEDFSNKKIGEVRKGDLLFPASWNSPARHPRGSLYHKISWDNTFDEWGMKSLR